MRRSIAILLLAIILIGWSRLTHGQDKKEPDKKEPDKKEPGKKEPEKKPYLMLLPPAGKKEIKVVEWRFVQGTRRFSLSPDAPAKPKLKSLPEYLEFREEKSTTFQNGILTLVPMTSLRKIEYSSEKKEVTVSVLEADDKEAALNGTTRFIGINKLTIEAEAVIDGLEGSATVKFQGGIDKGGLRGINFPEAKAVPAPKGAVATVIATDKEKSKHAVHDLQPLYLVNGQYRVLPYLMFKKTLKVDMDKVTAIRSVPPEDKKKQGYDFEVTLKDGAKHTLTLLTKIDITPTQAAAFEGLIGQAPAGYKLFPPHTIQEMYMGAPKERVDAE